MMLAVGAMTPNALAEHFNTSRQAVSKHLQILTECEIVTQEQQGREIHYHLNATKMKEIEKWLEQFKKLLAKRFNQLDEVLINLKHTKR
jgi:DNA-binding transcriptional ArsR family regulator